MGPAALLPGPLSHQGEALLGEMPVEGVQVLVLVATAGPVRHIKQRKAVMLSVTVINSFFQ